MMVSRIDRLALVGTVVMACVILWVTLTPDPPRLPTLATLTAATAGTTAEPGRAPGPVVPVLPEHWDAAEEEAFGHASLFAVMGAFAALWWATGPGWASGYRGLVYVLLALWLFGGLTELAQAMTLTRTPSLDDWGWDALGALAGAIAGWAAHRAFVRPTA